MQPGLRTPVSHCPWKKFADQLSINEIAGIDYLRITCYTLLKDYLQGSSTTCMVRLFRYLCRLGDGELAA